MKVLIALAFLVAGCYALKCGDFKSKADFNEVVLSVPTWYYGDTNHIVENCNVATYSGNDTTGNWNVVDEKGNAHMTCPMWKSLDDDKTWNLRVRQTGSQYKLGVAAHVPGQWFCWYQCDLNNDKIDFWHCAASDLTLFQDPNIWKQKLAESKLELDDLVTIYTNRNNCSSSSS